MRMYSNTKVSAFFVSITRDHRIKFLNVWNEQMDHSRKIYISYDSTNKNILNMTNQHRQMANNYENQVISKIKEIVWETRNSKLSGAEMLKLKLLSMPKCG